MSKRTAHKLNKWGMGKNPDAWVVVQGAVTQRHNGEADEWGHPELSVWQAIVWVNSQSGVGLLDGGGGTTAAEWWDWLATHVSTGMSSVHLFSLGATEQCSILGLWDCVLDGTAEICENADATYGNGKTGKREWHNGILVLGGPPTIVQFRLEGRDTIFTWLDPRNYGSGPLDLPVAGSEGGASEYRWIGEPHNVPDRVSVQVDAVGTWLQSYLDLLGTLKLGAIEHTAASQAMSGFRRKYMAEPITVHDNEAVTKIERNALYGGRCECYRIGTVGEHVYHLDVNSLYPSVAMTQSLPTSLECVVKFPSVETVLAAAKAIPCIARVYVDMSSPGVPYRYSHGSNNKDTRLVWPVGTFWTWLAGPELRLAAECGKIVKCTTLVAYQGRTIYRTFVEDLYAARLKARDRGDVASESAIKAMLNASFGKWAQTAKHWEDSPDTFCPWPFFQWYERSAIIGEGIERAATTFSAGADEMQQWRSLGGRVQKQVIEGEPSESFPAITAHIHAAGRVKLWGLIQAAGAGNCFYVDTDSVWVNGLGYYSLNADGLIDPVGLGSLKLVGSHNLLTLHGQKRYVADGKVTLAGASVGTMRAGDAFALQFKAPPTSHYLFHRRQPGTDRHTARIRLNEPYLHGHVHADGTVTPIKLRDGIADESYREKG